MPFLSDVKLASRPAQKQTSSRASTHQNLLTNRFSYEGIMSTLYVMCSLKWSRAVGSGLCVPAQLYAAVIWRGGSQLPNLTPDVVESKAKNAIEVFFRDVLHVGTGRRTASQSTASQSNARKICAPQLAHRGWILCTYAPRCSCSAEWQHRRWRCRGLPPAPQRHEEMWSAALIEALAARQPPHGPAGPAACCSARMPGHTLKQPSSPRLPAGTGRGS